MIKCMETKKQSILYIGGMTVSFVHCSRPSMPHLCSLCVAPSGLPYPRFVEYFHSNNSFNESGYFFKFENTINYMRKIFEFILKNRTKKIISLNVINIYNFQKYGAKAHPSEFIYMQKDMNIKIINIKNVINFTKTVLHNDLSKTELLQFEIKRKLEFIKPNNEIPF